ncbi:MAG TPA: sigma-E factor negative regulatory protein [Gammaproteobacteria bacterium]|jgi:sigma-E factor negative regulatory protein RseA
MSDQPYQNEHLSCFMDGELEDIHSVQSALGSREVHACWHRYHIIRDILRDSRPVKLSNDFCSRLMQSLENEPAVFNPRPFRSRKLPFNHSILKPVAGLAIAASVATVTVFLLQNVYLSPAGNGVPVVASAPQTESSMLALNERRNTGSGVAPVAVEGEEVIEDDSLNAYLIRHMEYASSGGTGMLPYVRLAGYDSSQ